MKGTHAFGIGFAIALAFGAQLAAAHAQNWVNIGDNINGTPPPASVQNWTRVSVLGQRTIIYMILWISPQKFERQPFEWLLSLQPDEYRRVESLGDDYSCLSPEAAISELHPLQVSKFSVRKGQADCILSARNSCAYLKRLAALPGIHGTEKKKN
jgi:hypothetical protein